MSVSALVRPDPSFRTAAAPCTTGAAAVPASRLRERYSKAAINPFQAEQAQNLQATVTVRAPRKAGPL